MWIDCRIDTKLHIQIEDATRLKYAQTALSIESLLIKRVIMNYMKQKKLIEFTQIQNKITL